MIKIYFDVCSLNRPFDDLTQDKIKIETEAIINIIQKVCQKIYLAYKSDAIDFELSKIQNSHKKDQVLNLYNCLNTKKIETTEQIKSRAKELLSYNIRYMDALHIAHCEYAGIDYMITTDKVLINQVNKSNILKVKVINPVIFVMEEM